MSWTQTHFEDVARVLREATFLDEIHREELAERFASLFIDNNPRFRPLLFLDAACGPGNYAARTLERLTTQAQERSG